MNPYRRDGRPHAIILAAGRGERLRPITDQIPKPLVQVAGHPLIAYGLGLLREAGIEDVVINVHHLADKMREALGDGSDFGVRIHYSVEETLLDSGGGIRQAATLLEPPVDGPIVVLNADLISEIPLRSVIDFHLENDALLTLVLRDDPKKFEYGTFGIDDDGRIQRFLGAGAPAGLPEYMFGSVQVLSPDVLGRMPEGAFGSMRGLYPELFAEGARFFGYRYEGPWNTGDTQEDLEQAETALRERGLPHCMRSA